MINYSMMWQFLEKFQIIVMPTCKELRCQIEFCYNTNYFKIIYQFPSFHTFHILATILLLDKINNHTNR